MSDQSRRLPNRWILVALILTLAVLDSASGDSANDNGTGPVPPSVFIRSPPDRSIVRTAGFEITGGLGGSVTTITVSIDGVDLGPARRGEDPNSWRFPADGVSLQPGLHRITVTATGDGGMDSSEAWVYYDVANSPFVVAVEPPTATYQVGDTSVVDDPDLLLFGPADDDVTLDLQTSAPPQLRVSTNARLSTGSLATLDLDVRDETPGQYVATVTATGPDGTTMTATHTVVIEEAASTSGVQDPAGGATRILFDAFESGADDWTIVMSGSNASTETVAILGSGGNPSGYRRMEHILPAAVDGENSPTQISVRHMYSAGGWDSGADGALSRIRYCEDQIEFAPPFTGAAVGTLFVLEQGGTVYSASLVASNAFTNTEWATVCVELGEQDFLQASGPDFSESGAPMTFGFLRSNTNRANLDIVTTHGIDNWTVELFASA